jgi:DNA polymerase I-like protein with 3'-5' exonuclease and polymerase domains
LTSSTQKTSSVVERAVAEIRAHAPALGCMRGTIGFDLETTGLDPRNSEIRLVSVNAGGKIYLLDAFKRDVRPVVEALAASSRVGAPVVAHNAAFEWGFVYEKFGVRLENLVDTYLLARLAACGDMAVACDLASVVERELGIRLDKEPQTSDWAADELTREQLRYAAMDVKVLPDLYEALSEAISETGQERVDEIEHACLPATALMKVVGLPVDKAAWNARAEEAERELRALERRMLDAPWLPPRPPVPQRWALSGADCLAMLHAAGVPAEGTTAKALEPFVEVPLVAALLDYRKAKGDAREKARALVLDLAPEKPSLPAAPWNFGSPVQVAEIAREILGFDSLGAGTDEGTLLRYRDRHPFFATMLEHRRLKKLVSTYGKTWFQKAYSEETGRVYPAWRQIGTSTGRFASGEKGVSPNAQNIPADYRKFFIAPAGRVFVDADYSQIEVRILAKMLEEEALLKVYERGEDVYRDTAASMLGLETVEDVSGEQRNLAKALMLGMSYGMSPRGLPYYAFKTFGIAMSPEEANDYVRAFYGLYPKIEAYHREVLAELGEMGGVDQRTLLGRLRADITNRNEAINAPVQGTAADVLKLALAKVYEGLKSLGETAFVVAAVHDEILVECDEDDADEVAAIVEKAMVEAMDVVVNNEPPKVRIKVDVSIGSKRWAKG